MEFLIIDDYVLLCVDPQVGRVYYKGDIGDKPVFTSSMINCKKFVNQRSAMIDQESLLRLYDIDTTIERLV